MIENIGIQYPTIEENMSNLTSASGEASISSSNRNDSNGGIHPPSVKKKRNQPGHPEPGAEVIALSPRTLLATNRFVCDVCNKGFQRDQNLQLHRRGHNLPWKLKQKTNKEVRKKVYICPEIGCVHHNPSRALGDLTGIKKHFYRKHGEKKWKCDKCTKKYAVQSDWKAHTKICGTREYKCDCGAIFSRRDSFITHRAFCDAIAQENARKSSVQLQNAANSSQISQFNTSQNLFFPIKKEQQNLIPPWLACSLITAPPPPPIDLPTPIPSLMFQKFNRNPSFSLAHDQDQIPNHNPNSTLSPFHHHAPPPPPPHISATALLQKVAQMGSKSSTTHFPSPPCVFTRPHQAHVSAGDSCHSSTTGFGPSRDEFLQGLSSYGNKAGTVTGGGTDTFASLGGNSINPSSSPSLIHEMMMMDNAGFEGSTFDDMAFGDILNHPSKKDHLSFHATLGEFSSSTVTNEGDNMTRDFLGLRPLSQSDILSITGLDMCINSNSCDENQNQTQKSWQD